MIVPRLRAPIVLVHGLLGYGRIRFGSWVLGDYFHHVPEALEAGGNRVLVASLSPTAGVAARAAQLRDFLDRQTPGAAVHLVAHSMGGLDSRYLISHLGMAARVLTLTTVGTPHRGTAFADWGIGHLARMVRPLFHFAGLPYQAFYDLTTATCREFNDRTPDAPGVRYFSVAGRFRLHWLAPEWQIPARIIERVEGPNDGVVSVASARWGEVLGDWAGDHLDLINWPRTLMPWRSRCDHTADYVALVRRLADEGF